MKKLFALILLASLTAVVGCSGDSTPAPETTNTEDSKSASNSAVEGTLVKLSVPNMT